MDQGEIVVERHRRKSTIISSNREPAVEWLAMTSDTLLAQSAIDRLTQGAHTLVIEGPSWRQRGTLNRRAAIDENKETSNAN